MIAGHLTENGRLLIVEPAGESLEILISQAFMITDTDDVRNEKNQTFMDHEQWQQVLADVGLRLEKTYPSEDSPMDMFGQKLYIAGRAK